MPRIVYRPMKPMSVKRLFPADTFLEYPSEVRMSP